MIFWLNSVFLCDDFRLVRYFLSPEARDLCMLMLTLTSTKQSKKGICDPSQHPLMTMSSISSESQSQSGWYEAVFSRFFFFWQNTVFLLYLFWCLYKTSQISLDFSDLCVQGPLLWLLVCCQNLWFYFCYIDRKEILIQYCVFTLSARLYKSLYNPRVWCETESERTRSSIYSKTWIVNSMWENNWNWKWSQR